MLTESSACRTADSLHHHATATLGGHADFTFYRRPLRLDLILIGATHPNHDLGFHHHLCALLQLHCKLEAAHHFVDGHRAPSSRKQLIAMS